MAGANFYLPQLFIRFFSLNVEIRMSKLTFKGKSNYSSQVVKASEQLSLPTAIQLVSMKDLHVFYTIMLSLYSGF